MAMRKVVSLLALVSLVFCFMSPVTAIVVFSDDFSGGDLSQWTVVSGTWAIESGELSGTGTSWTNIVAGDINWDNYILEVKVKPISRYSGLDSTIHAPGILARYKDESNFLMLYLRQGGTTICLGRKLAGVWSEIMRVDFAWSNNKWYVLKLEVDGLTAVAYVNGTYLFTASIPSDLANGKIGVEAYNSHAHFDNVIVLNPDFHVIPEPATVIVSVLSVAALATYLLIRKRPTKKL